MIFNTIWFLVFYAAFYALFLCLPNARVRLYFTLAASVLFQYHFAGPAGLFPILVMGCATYLFALPLGRIPPGSRSRKTLYVAALTVPLLGLISYKYRALFLGSLSGLVGGSAGGWLQAHAVSPALPLGISFFTFEFVHYLTDVYRGSKPIRGVGDFSIFCFFFPSIVAGPIKRYQPFLQQLVEGWPRPGAADAAEGFRRILTGYFKKLVIADNATMMVQLLQGKTDGSPLSVLALMLLLSIRIYYDFSGYTDIAVGLARMLGVAIPENFRTPYLARNISDFWNRWHMSLSSWIRDYVYIPLGGNRRGPVRKVANGVIAMFLCGLWHGPAWHFGLWGVYNGFGLAFHGIWEKSGWGRGCASSKAWGWASLALNDLFVAYGWLLFFYPMADVAHYTRTLLGG